MPDFSELQIILARLERSDFLCKNSPKCLACGHEQVQLVDRYSTPAQWKCRICRHRFGYEPTLENDYASDGPRASSLDQN